MRWRMGCGKELPENFGVPICDDCFNNPTPDPTRNLVEVTMITPEERKMRAKMHMVTPEQRKAAERAGRYVPSENPFKC